MDLRVHIESQEGKELVRLEGRINEDAEVVLPELLEKITGNCIFHFQGVESINSCGIRAWIHFMREVEKKGSILLVTSEVIDRWIAKARKLGFTKRLLDWASKRVPEGAEYPKMHVEFHKADDNWNILADIPKGAI